MMILQQLASSSWPEQSGLPSHWRKVDMHCPLLHRNSSGLHCPKNDKAKFLICFLFLSINRPSVSWHCKLNRRMMYTRDVFTIIPIASSVYYKYINDNTISELLMIFYNEVVHRLHTDFSIWPSIHKQQLETIRATQLTSKWDFLFNMVIP